MDDEYTWGDPYGPPSRSASASANRAAGEDARVQKSIRAASAVRRAFDRFGAGRLTAEGRPVDTLPDDSPELKGLANIVNTLQQRQVDRLDDYTIQPPDVPEPKFQYTTFDFSPRLTNVLDDPEPGSFKAAMQADGFIGPDLFTEAGVPVSDTELSAPVETGDGQRKDDNKIKGFYLLPTRPLEEVARLYQIGANKYTPRGWEKGMAWSRVLDPMFRHLFKWIRGERYDKVDGQHHLASVIWAALALMEYEETHPELDDIHTNNGEQS